MNNRERFSRTIGFEPVDHPPLMLAEGWPATRNRWAEEGLPRHVDLYEHFGLEPFNSRHVGIETVFHPPFEERILEESDDFVVKINRRGVTEKNFKDGSSMPEFVGYPVEGPEAISWLKEKLNPDTPGRVRTDWLHQAQTARSAGKLVFCNGGQYFAFLNEHAGTERLLYMYFDAPDFVHRVNELQCVLCESALNIVLPEFKLDYIGYHEDMAYKNGSMIAPDMFREFMSPYYRRITGIAREHGVDIHYMDSDGDIRELVPLWIECGIRLVSPLEVAAGMDVAALRREYGKELAMVGGFDKRILAAGKPEIRAELERLRPVIEGGGYIPTCDHAVPPDVSLENYAFFVQTLKSMYGINV